jgi:hypothetical protein
MLYLNCRNVLTKNYKYQVSYLLIMGLVFRKLVKLKIPYFIKRSNLSKEVIEEIDKTVRFLNRS